MPAESSYKAKWVITDPRVPPLEDAVVFLQNGVITDVSDREADHTIDLGHAILMPGLINAHTHLEFSTMKTPLTTRHPFTGWIQELMQLRGENRSDIKESLRVGIKELNTNGTLLAAEICTYSVEEICQLGDSLDQLIFCKEVIGLIPAQIEQRLVDVESWISHMKALQPGTKLAISPHAPYSVHPDLLSQLLEIALRESLPVVMHLAETQDEIQFLDDQTGNFRSFLENLELYQTSLFTEDYSVSTIIEQLSLAEKSLLVHGNYLTNEQIAQIAMHPQMSVVYCPRTHHYFGHQHHPWQKLLLSDVNVVLGTDSKASNPDLSIWKEVLFLHSMYPVVSFADLLCMVTVRAAEALGLEQSHGTIEVGKSAELSIAIPDAMNRGSLSRALCNPGTKMTSLTTYLQAR